MLGDLCSLTTPCIVGLGQTLARVHIQSLHRFLAFSAASYVLSLNVALEDRETRIYIHYFSSLVHNLLFKQKLMIENAENVNPVP